ncbi:MAG: hypothetical protein L0216_00060 [Planctomycetales bacterium]|nr:hypothetical protein [Planctomycetales bacterium]
MPDLAATVAKAWRGFAADRRANPTLVWSEHDMVFLVASRIAAALGDGGERWVHLEASMGRNRRLDLLLTDPARWERTPWTPECKPEHFDLAIEFKSVLDGNHKNYSAAAVRADLEKLKAQIAEGRIRAAMCCVFDARTKPAPADFTPLAEEFAIPVLVATYASPAAATP